MCVVEIDKGRWHSVDKHAIAGTRVSVTHDLAIAFRRKVGSCVVQPTQQARRGGKWLLRNAAQFWRDIARHERKNLASRRVDAEESRSTGNASASRWRSSSCTKSARGFSGRRTVSPTQRFPTMIFPPASGIWRAITCPAATFISTRFFFAAWQHGSACRYRDHLWRRTNGRTIHYMRRWIPTIVWRAR